MAKAVSNLVQRAPIWAREYAQPRFQTFLKYARVELTPPTPGEFPQVASGIQKLLSGARTGRWKQLTVKEAWLNTLVTVKFYVGSSLENV